MVAREDYGNAGREGNKLVPAALTAYRHFRLTLTPQGGVRLAPMTGGDSERYMVYDDTSTEFFEAKCIPFATYFVGPGAWWRGKHPYYQEHPTPSLECTCGFYAHYYPDTDFYEDEYWKLMEDATDLTGARITVRAVVEAAGRVVAGDLGVRAERIKVKALAVDWGKLLISDPGDTNYPASYMVLAHRDPDPVRDQLLIRNVKDVVARGAATYRAEFYDSADVMYGEYPQQDLSALGINAMTMEQWKERKRRDEERRAEEFRLQVASFGNAFGGRRAWDSFSSFSMTTSSGTSALTRQGLEEIFGPGTVTAMRDSLDASIAKRAADTPMQRAILNKKNRPAPPGTGIDRRKKHL